MFHWGLIILWRNTTLWRHRSVMFHFHSSITFYKNTCCISPGALCVEETTVHYEMTCVDPCTLTPFCDGFTNAADLNDPTSFYTCDITTGYWIHRSCAPGTVFDPGKDKCHCDRGDPPVLEPCPTTPPGVTKQPGNRYLSYIQWFEFLKIFISPTMHRLI